MVKYLKYKKQDVPVRLSYRALKALKGKDLSRLMAGNSMMEDDIFEDLLWAGIQSGHSAEDKECPFKKENVEDILDECFLEFVKMIPEFFDRGKEKDSGNASPNLSPVLETPALLNESEKVLSSGATS